MIKIYVVSDRKTLPALVKIVKEIEPDAFYIAEQAGFISKIRRPTMVPATGWRAVQKKK